MKQNESISLSDNVYVIKYPFVSAFLSQKLRFQKSQFKISVW